NVVAYFLQIFGDVGRRIFFLEFLDKAIHQYRSRLLLEVAELARELAGKRQRFAINDRKLLPELLVFALQFLRGDIFEFPFLHQLDRKSTRLNSSHGSISYAVFCLKKKKNNYQRLRLYPCTQGYR